MTTVKAQNTDNFKGYDRSQKAIIVYDAVELSPVDTLPVKELLHENQENPTITHQRVPNSEIFKLMKEEEEMREMREPEP